MRKLTGKGKLVIIINLLSETGKIPRPVLLYSIYFENQVKKRKKSGKGIYLNGKSAAGLNICEYKFTIQKGEMVGDMVRLTTCGALSDFIFCEIFGVGDMTFLHRRSFWGASGT